MAFREFTGELDPPKTGKFKEFTGELDQPRHTAPQPTASRLDTVVGSGVGRILLGAAQPYLGIGQAGAHLIDTVAGTELGKKADSGLQAIEASKKRGMQAFGHDPEGIDLAGFGGSLLGAAPIANMARSALPAAVGPLSRAGVSAVQGAAVGAASPTKGEDFSSEKARQALMGGALGGLFSIGSDLVRGGAKVVGDVIGPLTEKGRAAFLDQFQQRMVPKEARERIAQALMQGREIVPGSTPTAGEIMASHPESTSLASHQATLERMSYPIATAPEFAARRAAQESARLGQIHSFGKTPADLAAGLKDRETIAGTLYQHATGQSVPKNQALHDLLRRPSMQDAYTVAERGAKERGGIIAGDKDPTISGEDLQRMKLAMDDQVSTPERFGLVASQAREVNQSRRALIDWMIQHVPGYEKARDTYRNLSQAPNQMQIGQVLEDALRSPLGTKERSTVFANAVNNAPNTIKKATGQRVYDDLSKILTPENEQKVKSVLDDLARHDEYLRRVRQSTSGSAGAIPGNVEPALPNILSRPAMVANYAMKKIGESAEEKIAKEAARRYLDDPQAIARALLRTSPVSRNRQIIDALMRHAPVAAGTIGGQVDR